MKALAMNAMKIPTCLRLFASTANLSLFIALLAATASHVALAQATAPSLGTASSFAVLAGSAVTNTGPTVLIGDLGVSPGTSITGFSSITLAGTSYTGADSKAGGAQTDTGYAYVDLADQPCKPYLTDLGGLTLTPGVYCFSSSAGLTGTLTLDAQHTAGAVWVFQIGSSLTTASGSSVVLKNGAQACNVFWQVGSSATLGTTTNFAGNILALASITLNTGAMVSGSALARNGAVTMDTNKISLAACSTSVPPIPPTLSKSFSPSTVSADEFSTLTITLSNTDIAAAILSSPLIDTLPSGLKVSGSGSTTCTDGDVTAITGGSTVTLKVGSIPAKGSCTVKVPVIAAAGGNYVNSLHTGALETNNGSNAAPAVATLTVNAPVGVLPTLGKAFSPATTVAGGVSILTITLSNAGATASTLTEPLIDKFPSGVTVSSGGSTTCGGTVTADKGSSSVTLTGGSIPAKGTCKVTVLVTAPVAGNYYNSLATGSLRTSNGSNASPAIATLTVTAPAGIPPTLAKAFSPATINAGGVSTLTITLHNANSTAAALTAPLTDNLPNGMTVAGSGATTCGGKVTAAKGSSTVTLTGGSIPANGSCTVTVPVTAQREKCNCVNFLLIGALKTTKGSNIALATAGLTVNPAAITTPIVSKSFAPTTIKPGGVSTLTIKLRNPSGAVETITAPFTDYFPSGMLAAGAATNTCGGVSSAHAGSTSVTLTGGSIPADGSCYISVKVTATRAGNYNNELTACSLHTSNGCNTYPYTALFTVGIRLVKAFTPATISLGQVSELTITLDNPATTAARLTAPLTDKLPAGLFVAGIAGTTCGGAVTAASGGSTVTLTGGSIPAASACKVTVNVTAKNPGCYYNTLPAGALQTSNGSNAAPFTATVTIN